MSTSLCAPDCPCRTFLDRRAQAPSVQAAPGSPNDAAYTVQVAACRGGVAEIAFIYRDESKTVVARASLEATAQLVEALTGNRPIPATTTAPPPRNAVERLAPARCTCGHVSDQHRDNATCSMMGCDCEDFTSYPAQAPSVHINAENLPDLPPPSLAEPERGPAVNQAAARVHIALLNARIHTLEAVREAARTVMHERDDSAATVCEQRLLDALNAAEGS